jgi:hypothetical protein
MASGQDWAVTRLKIEVKEEEKDICVNSRVKTEEKESCPLAADQNAEEEKSIWEVTPPFTSSDASDGNSDWSTDSMEDDLEKEMDANGMMFKPDELTAKLNDLLNVTMLEGSDASSDLGEVAVKQENDSCRMELGGVDEQCSSSGEVIVTKHECVDLGTLENLTENDLTVDFAEVPRVESEHLGSSDLMSDSEANGAVNSGEVRPAGGSREAVMALTPEDKHFIFTVLPTIRPTEIDLEAKNIVAELERFTCDFEEQLEAAIEPGLLTKIPAAQKTAAWKVALGPSARELIRTFEWEQGEDKNSITLIRQKLVEAVSTPSTRRIAMEKFWEARQETNEPVKDFIGRLEVLSVQAQWNKATPDDFMAVRLGSGLRGKDLRTWVRAQPQATTLAEIKKHVLATEALEKEDQTLQAMKDERGQGRQHHAFANKEGNGGADQKKNGGNGRPKAEKFNCGYCGTMHF